MKRILGLIAFLCLGVAITNAQEIKVKKEIVYIDEVPTLKMVGDCGIFKRLHYSFLTMSGDTLFRMKDDYFSFTDPRFETLVWHEFIFKGSDMPVRIKKDYTYVTDKQVMKLIYSFQPPIIANGNLDNDAVTKFIEKNDITASIKADTARCLSFERLQKAAVLSSTLARDIKKEIIIANPMDPRKYNLKGFGTYSVFEIFQDRVLIGLVVQVVTQSASETKTKCYFLKRLVQPFEHDGLTNEYGMVGYVDDMNGLSGMNYMFIKGINYSASTQSANKMLDYIKNLVQVGAL